MVQAPRGATISESFFVVLLVGTICFLLSLYLFLLIGLRAGFMKLGILEPAPPAPYWWWIIVWTGSVGLSAIAGLIVFRLFKRLRLPP
jgi:uncharacterized BrkB/YihY/UPF0761 family membrane protein